jgi:hypothetical protein
MPFSSQFFRVQVMKNKIKLKQIKEGLLSYVTRMDLGLQARPLELPSFQNSLVLLFLCDALIFQKILH